MGDEVKSHGGIQLFQDTNLPPTWEFKTLGSMCTIRRGASPRPAGDPRYFGEGKIPWIKIGDVTKTGGRYVESTAVFVNEEGAKRSVRIPPGSLIIANSGVSLGFAAFTKVEGCIHDGWLLVTAFEGLDPNFLFYCINILTSRLRTLADGTTQPNLNTDLARRLLVPTPSLCEQKYIAKILGSLDDKIELDRQMNATLESMGQALFKSWFVDFDPVIDNAIGAGNPIPKLLLKRAEKRKALGDKRRSLPEAIQLQFPSEFIFSEEIGWIPKGWEIARIKDIAQIIKGRSYKSSELEESTTALVTLKSFNRGGGYRLDGLKEYTGVFKPEQEVFAGDLILAYTDITQAADVIGKPAMVVSDSRYEHLVVSLDVSVVRPSIDSYKYFLYGTAQTDRFQDHTYAYSTGTTVLHLAKNAVPDYCLAMPGNEIVTAYVRVVRPKYQTIDNNISEIGKLGRLRDTLLPKLLSGQLRIPDAEKLVANAV